MRPFFFRFPAAALEPTHRQWWWRVGRRAATVQADQNASQNCFQSFRAIFVNFTLINVIFV